MTLHRHHPDTAVLILRIWSADDAPDGVCGRLLDASGEEPVAWRTGSGRASIIAAVGCWLSQFIDELPADRS